MASIKNLVLGDHRDPQDELVEAFGQPGDTAEASVGRAREWASSVIADNGLDAGDQVASIVALRKARPGLGLKSATHLASLLRH